METVVTVRCVKCKVTREIKPGEIGPDDFPMCEVCYMPMMAERAERK